MSASSSEIGMKLEDGKTVRFDMVGNQRAQDLLKNDKRVEQDISANKPIRAKVSGVLNGDKLIVAAQSTKRSLMAPRARLLRRVRGEMRARERTLV